jgi:Fanconi anemia group M protein
VIDDRENSSGLAAAVSRWWEPVCVGRLPVGHVEIGPVVLVERKTVSDFVLSLEDRRLFRQLAALSRASRRPLLIVEGEDALDAGALDPLALRGVLLTVTVGFRVPMLRTSSVADTAIHIAHIARQEARRAARRATDDSPPGRIRAAIAVLAAIPGVGDWRARRLLESFGSLRGVFEAGEEELAGTPGIGPATVESLRRTAEARPGPGSAQDSRA